MSQGVSCPACGSEKLDVRRYDAMMVVRADLALFTLRCPRCGAVVASMQRIPAELLDEVRFAAIEVGAGMGREGRRLAGRSPSVLAVRPRRSSARSLSGRLLRASSGIF